MSRCPVPHHLLFLLLLVVATVAVAKPRIIGGHDARRGQFPYQVLIRRLGSFECGGSIIASRWILTAAHCASSASDPSQFTVIIGALRLHDDGQSYQVDRITSKDFDLLTASNDVALLRLSEDIGFNANVQPIAFEGPVVGGQEQAVFSGWGDTGAHKPPSEVLKFVNTTTITNAECKDRVGSSGYQIHDSSICTFRRGTSECSGDSGGPLVVNGVLAGVDSWGVEACGLGFAEVYTRVSSYVQWINQTIGHNKE